MPITWILAADSSRARIFELQDMQDHLQEIEDFTNPAGRMDEKELRSDPYGRFYGQGGRYQANTGEPDQSRQEHAAELFSKRVSEFLDHACSEHRYDKLCLIAYPKFLGLMRSNFSKQVQQRVEEEVSKDISGLEARDIEEYVRNRLH